MHYNQVLLRVEVTNLTFRSLGEDWIFAIRNICKVLKKQLKETIKSQQWLKLLYVWAVVLFKVASALSFCATPKIWKQVWQIDPFLLLLQKSSCNY